MAKSFSVSVEIGGKLSPSLGSAVKAAESRFTNFSRHLTAINASTTAAINSVGRSISAAGTKMQSAGRGLTSSVTTPLGLIGGFGFNAAYQFEKTANAVQAVGSLTDDQMASLRAYVKELNSAFPYTNAEIMKASEELSKAGFNFEQMRGSLRSTLNLGLAGDIGLKESADIATNILTAMNLPRSTAEEASRSLAAVSDNLAYAANRSNTDVRLMGETFKYVGPMARAAGLDINDVAAASMIMANNGIKGSEAGVAMRSALVRMVKPTKPMIAALARLNINLGDFVKGTREVTSADIISSLGVDGIDASGSKRAIDQILKNPKLQAAPEKMIAELTKAVSRSLGSDSVVDKDKLSDSISTALTAAGSQVDLAGFFKALKERGANLPDVANIFDARQGARLITLLFEGDLAGAAAEVAKNSQGIADQMSATRMKGIVGEVAALSAALENLSTTIGESGVLRDIGRGLAAISDGLQSLSKQNPTLLRFATWGLMATAALGPFLLVAGSAARVIGFLAPALLNLGRAATLGLAVRLGAIAKGVGALALATAGGIAGRIRALAAGLVMLGTVGGSRAVLSGLAGGLSSFGRSVLMFPVTALRAIGSAAMLLVANPIGIAITAIVTALAALGVWVYNNWDGLKSFFSGFAEGLKAGLNPTLVGYADGLASAFGSLFRWISDLLGPLQGSNEAWASWGATVGGAVAQGINAVASGIERVIGLFKSAYEWAVSLKNTIANFTVGGGSPTPPHIAQGLSRGGPIRSAPAIAGARAAGGPVIGGKTYLVGEEGPELFTPGRSGEIVSNDRLAGLNARSGGGGGRARALNATFNIYGATDPQAVARQCREEFRRFLWQMEAEQRALLSD